MGRAARANVARQTDPRNHVYWRACRVCRDDYPTQVKPTDGVAVFDVCQRCCVADLASLMRSHPATVVMLPSVRSMQDKPQAIAEMPKGLA